MAGRPKVYDSPAARQAAYMERKRRAEELERRRQYLDRQRRCAHPQVSYVRGLGELKYVGQCSYCGAFISFVLLGIDIPDE